jgi:hypothetical protein
MKKLIFTTCVLLTLNSCVKEKKDTLERIEVRNENNALVENAMVILYGTSTCNCPSQPIIRDTSYTNSQGIAMFNYNKIYQLGQAGVAVLDIEASKGTRQGQGIIKIEAEKLNEETIYIQP